MKSYTLQVVNGFRAGICVGLVFAGCASWSEPDSEVSDSDACAEEARKVSGYRGLPVRAEYRAQQRNDERWETFYRVYDECMRNRSPDEDD